MKKLSTGTEKDVLQAASRLAEILSLENFENRSLINLGKNILSVTDDPTLLRRFNNGREQKLELFRDLIVDFSAGAPWLKKGSFGLTGKDNSLKKIYILDELQLKGRFVFEAKLSAQYKKPDHHFTQEEVNAATYYLVYLWSQLNRALAEKASA